mgnify:CR=1 FL=1
MKIILFVIEIGVIMLDEESRCQEIDANSEDYAEGLNAFLEKRPAKFKGI